MLSCLISALRTLTALPVPGPDCERHEDSLYAFPAVGAILGGLLCMAAQLFGKLPAAVTATLLLILQTLLTRGFHLDGIADAADGFGGGYTRERALEIMKDSRIGAFGTIALILTLLLKFTLLNALLKKEMIAALFAAMVISRTAQVFQCVTLPYARANGTAATSVQNALPQHLGTALGTGIILLLFSGFKALPLMLIGLGSAWLWGRYCLKRVGGITGDLLGATSELTELAVLTGALILW